MARFADKTPVFAIRSFGKRSQLDHAAFIEHLYKLGEHRWQWSTSSLSIATRVQRSK